MDSEPDRSWIKESESVKATGIAFFRYAWKEPDAGLFFHGFPLEGRAGWLGALKWAFFSSGPRSAGVIPAANINETILRSGRRPDWIAEVSIQTFPRPGSLSGALTYSASKRRPPSHGIGTLPRFQAPPPGVDEFVFLRRSSNPTAACKVRPTAVTRARRHETAVPLPCLSPGLSPEVNCATATCPWFSMINAAAALRSPGPSSRYAVLEQHRPPAIQPPCGGRCPTTSLPRQVDPNADRPALEQHHLPWVGLGVGVIWVLGFFVF